MFPPCFPPCPRGHAPWLRLLLPFLPLLSRSSLLTRALRVSPAHFFATPALPPLAPSLCHVFSPLPTTSPRPNPSSQGGALLAPYCPTITVRYKCLCCTCSRGFHSWISPIPYSNVATLSPGVRSYLKASCPGPPMWVSCVWHDCALWTTKPPNGLILGWHWPRPQSAGHPCALRHLRCTIIGLLVLGMAPSREVPTALALLCCLSTQISRSKPVCTPADTAARRVVCPDPGAIVS